MPDASQTSRIPVTDGTRLVTDEGWTKMADPIIVPTTIAVAWGRRMARRSCGLLLLDIFSEEAPNFPDRLILWAPNLILPCHSLPV